MSTILAPAPKVGYTEIPNLVATDRVVESIGQGLYVLLIGIECNEFNIEAARLRQDLEAVDILQRDQVRAKAVYGAIERQLKFYADSENSE